ncbi:hypothetical protein [Acinetobacter tianfuensis]|uniref:Uncharacterized protein n=1 Tax=Acinetobacter tianfuensis TaxID=2419603 RepID=A0A3A8EJN5_9GAMM|nr:hypothetical protein [Acinetobacter tianfuensis]RKG29111.1 hypothetical protein D7V32_16445 [Acinetobacter tianfuensis]
MIICESIEYVESLQMDMGRSCVHVDLLQLINESVGITMSQANDLLALQASIYTLILAYMWLVKGVSKVDE